MKKQELEGLSNEFKEELTALHKKHFTGKETIKELQEKLPAYNIEYREITNREFHRQFPEQTTLDCYYEVMAADRKEVYQEAQIAFKNFYDTPVANFPECPYEGFEDLETEWLSALSDAAANVEDISLCTYCGSKNIWMCNKVVWCSVNKNDIDDFYYKDNEYPDVNTLCKNCDYEGNIDNHFCDLSQYIYDLQPYEQ